MEPFALTPEPPYHAVIFTSTASADPSDYAATAARMIELAADVPGFLGVESVSERGATASGAGSSGITVSYWEDEEAIATWKADLEHTAARNEGRSRWYDGDELRVAPVERAYGWRRRPTRSSPRDGPPPRP